MTRWTAWPAQHLVHEARGQTLQATVFVQKAYLRLLDGRANRASNERSHFLRGVAETMRRILVDNARRTAISSPKSHWPEPEMIS
jgi:hypothetical protein